MTTNGNQNVAGSTTGNNMVTRNRECVDFTTSSQRSGTTTSVMMIKQPSTRSGQSKLSVISIVSFSLLLIGSLIALGIHQSQKKGVRLAPH